MCLYTFQQGWAACLVPQLPGICDMIDSWTFNLLSMPPPPRFFYLEMPALHCSPLLTSGSRSIPLPPGFVLLPLQCPLVGFFSWAHLGFHLPMGHSHGLGSVYSGHLVKYHSDEEPRCALVSPQDGEEQDVQGLRTKGMPGTCVPQRPRPTFVTYLSPVLCR